MHSRDVTSPLWAVKHLSVEACGVFSSTDQDCSQQHFLLKGHSTDFSYDVQSTPQPGITVNISSVALVGAFSTVCKNNFGDVIRFGLEEVLQ